MKVAVEYIRWLREELVKINKPELEDIEFFENSVLLEIDPKLIEDFKFTGLGNVGFIETGFYKEGFSEVGDDYV